MEKTQCLRPPDLVEKGPGSHALAGGWGTSGAPNKSLLVFEQKEFAWRYSHFSSPFCGSFQTAALVPSFLSRHTNTCFASPACFNPATVSLSPSICVKITELEEGFVFISFVFWVFCPGNFHFNVLAPSLVVEHNTHDLRSPLAPASSAAWEPWAAAPAQCRWVRDVLELRSLPSAGELCLGRGPGPLRARTFKGLFYNCTEHLHQMTEIHKIQLWYYHLKFCWNSQSSILLGDH